MAGLFYLCFDLLSLNWKYSQNKILLQSEISLSDQSLLILLGNQLFSEDIISRANCEHIFMAEDYNLCSYEKHHKLKILMFLAAMREKRDELRDAGYKVDYFDIEHRLFTQDYEIKLDSVIEEHFIRISKKK